MSSRSLPFLASTASKIEKDRPLTEAEFPEVWRHYERFVRAAAARTCPSNAAVDDVVQETAIFFLARVREGGVPAAAPVISKLLRLTAWNMARSERRKSRGSRHTSLDGDAPPVLVANDVSPEIATEARSLARRVAAVGPGCMNAKRWTVVSLHYLQGEEHDEIQAAMGMNGSTLRGDLLRGRIALRDALDVDADAA